SYTLSFGATGLTPATAAITLSAGAASVIAANSPTTQSAPAGSAVSSPPSVIVHDGSGNPVQGVTVTFAAAVGSGSDTEGTRPTTRRGTATDGGLCVNTTAGA